jgi:hypothetical protein
MLKIRNNKSRNLNSLATAVKIIFNYIIILSILNIFIKMKILRLKEYIFIKILIKESIYINFIKLIFNS